MRFGATILSNSSFKSLAALALAGWLLLAPGFSWALHALALGYDPKYSQGFDHFDYANPNAPKGGEVAIAVPSTGFDSLNPLLLKGNPPYLQSLLTLETLGEGSLDEPFTEYGLLAKDMRVDPDGLWVEFELDPDARFSNGDPVLAIDVKKSFDIQTTDPLAGMHTKMYFQDVKEAKVMSERVVRFTFKQKNTELPLILNQLSVFSHKSYPNGLENTQNVAPIGSGPYFMKSSDGSRNLEYVRNPNYWAKDKGIRKGQFNFDKIRVRFYPELTARTEAIKAGEVDFHAENTARTWARSFPDSIMKKRGLEKMSFKQHSSYSMQSFVFNLRRDKFKDVKVREALNLTFDFEWVASRMFYNSYKRSYSFFSNTELACPDYASEDEKEIYKRFGIHPSREILDGPVPRPPVTDPVKGIRPNLKRARDLLLEAGFSYKDGKLLDPKGEPFTIDLLLPGKNFEAIVVKWKEDLAKIGIRLMPKVVDSSLYMKKVQSFDYDILSAGYANSVSPGNEQLSMHSCESVNEPGTMNIAGLCDPDIDKLLKGFMNYKDRKELVTLSHTLDRLLLHKRIVIPQWYGDTYNVIAKKDLRHPDVIPLYYNPTVWFLQYWWKDPAADKNKD